MGSYTVAFTASDSGFEPTVLQKFVLTIDAVDQPPTITSAATDTIASAAQMKPFVVTTDDAYASLSASGLPASLKFTDDTTNGTAAMTGKPTRGERGTYHVKITAKNDFGTAVQSFTLVIS